MSGSAIQFDQADSLSKMRQHFCIPKTNGQEEIYFVGNSLGLMPRRVEDYLQVELDSWKTIGVRGHFEGSNPWGTYAELLARPMANLVGCLPEEVVTMNTLTVNLHLMMATFYRPTPARYKILIEDHAFPSDQHAVASQIQWHGLDPEKAVIRVRPPAGEHLISDDQICKTIKDQQASLALVMLPGVQYYTGQVFDMEAITSVAHRFGIPVGFDLAHAAGNIPMRLHDWDVDFAAWCTYKYLNSGPGSLAGCFVNQRHATNTKLGRLAGWWGHDKSSRFQMSGDFVPIPTAEGWQLSNPPILSLAAIRASLDVFEEAGGIHVLRERAVRMNQFFRELLAAKLGDRMEILTPVDRSGCQLSLRVDSQGKSVFDRLNALGVRTDWREPGVIRAAPTPLYNTFAEIEKFVMILKECLE